MLGPRRITSDFRIVLCFVAVASGCPAGRQSSAEANTFITTENEEAERAFRDATTTLEEGDQVRAQAKFQAFLSRFPDDPLAAVSHLQLGRLLLRDGQLAASREHIEQLTNHPDSTLRERAAFVRGLLLHAQGQHQAALDVLLPFVGRTVDPQGSIELLRAVADASLAVEKPVQALVALNELVSLDQLDEDRAEIMERVDFIVQDTQADQIHAAIEALPPGGPVWERAASHGVTVAYAAGDMDRVRALIEALEQNGVELSESLQGIALRAERPEHPDAQVIGALLPLSGPGRVVGQLALQALLLASGSPQLVRTPGPRVVFRDVAGGPDAPPKRSMNWSRCIGPSL